MLATPTSVTFPSEHDRFCIQDVIHRYNRSIDNGDLEEFLSVFAADGVKYSPTYWGELRGRSALHEWFQRFFSSAKHDGYRGGQHRVANLIFDSVTGNEIRTWCNFTLVMPSADGPYISVIGNYRDTFTRQKDGRWLIQRREIEIVSDGTKGDG